MRLAAGRYIVAVSGGVDSMVLLDLLSKNDNLELIVAHFDHGIRSDSVKDMQLVENVAHRLGLKFISEKACILDFCQITFTLAERFG